DSTVNYALGTSKQFLTQSDLKVESAYNTYLHTGLPPTPIDSPGQAALQAALNPAVGNLLYFVTMDPNTGETRFTNSVSQFKTWRDEAQKNFSAAASAAATAKP
ncbi:MAG TPA: endolytic transglycosylase MltG, partial [Acidothermaceae bacterium]|nr:endolytic transglycosylase MltG [Acidothermaceae bacterium]